MFKKKSSIVGLDIGSRSLKVAEISDSKKGRSIKKFGMTEIEPGLIEEGTIRNPEEVAGAIRQLMGIYRIKEPNVAVSVGGYSIIVKTIEVQSMPEAQLQETIQFEAEQYIPFDINDVNIDFQIMGENASNPNQMSVLLVAAKKEMINEYVSLVEMAGLNPCIIDVDAFALQNVYEVNYETENENVALIDIGANKTTLNILKGNKSVFMRDVSLGCQQINMQIVSLQGCSIEEAEKYYREGAQDQIISKEIMQIISSVIADWCAEIKRALDFFYSTYPDDTIRKIVVSGGGANIRRFLQQLAAETGIEVEVINPFKNFTLDVDVDDGYLKQITPQAAICLGLALRRIDDK